MDIRFYDLTGALRLISNDCLSLSIKKSLRSDDAGYAEFLAGHEVFDLIENEKALILTAKDFQGITTGYTIQNGTLKITVKPLITLLSRRLLVCENLVLSGNPLTLIRDLIRDKAPYITLSGTVETRPSREFKIKKTCDLLTVAKQLLEGTRTGIKIEFVPQSRTFKFEFIYPRERQIRLSSGNRNLSKITCKSDFDRVQNSAYCSMDFDPLIEVTDSIADSLTDCNPQNYMKQYFSRASRIIAGISVGQNSYIYSDTPDGKLKVAYEQQVSSIQRICLEDEPCMVIECDCTDLNSVQTEELLNIRKYRSESFYAVPHDDTLELGDLVLIEKEIGTLRGLKQLQVTEISWDSSLSYPEITIE